MCDAEIDRVFSPTVPIRVLQNENHPKKAMVDSLRNQLHELKTGVLQGHVINKKSNADGRVSRAGETLRTLGDYTDRGNTQEGVVKLLDLARKLQEKDEL